MSGESEPAPDTLRTCEACGGGVLADSDECPWCDHGFQSEAQLEKWSAFRKRWKKTSGTYSFLEAIVKDVLNRLKERGTQDALDLHTEGQALLKAWQLADPLYGGRDRYTNLLTKFNQRALDYLTKTPTWWSNRP